MSIVNIDETMQILKCMDRPNVVKYIDIIFDEFIELHGDRICGDDPAIVSGIALLEGTPVTVIGQKRGMNFDEQIKYNFSMTRPEGYRKSLRAMKLAEKFRRPIICFIDTIGADPGIHSERSGQVTAISNCIIEMMSLKVPIISILIGFGGSGGALALCIADNIAILENAVFSVISPKACAEILWRDMSREREAMKVLKMTSQELFDMNIVDCIIPEPKGGAQVDLHGTARLIKEYLLLETRLLSSIPIGRLVMKRQAKYRKM